MAASIERSKAPSRVLLGLALAPMKEFYNAVEGDPDTKTIGQG